MRFNSKQKELLSKYNGEHWDNFFYYMGKKFKQLAEIGIMVAYADAIQVNNRGLLLVGQSGAGKTSVSMLLTKKRGSILKHDSPTLYVQDGGLYSFQSDEDYKFRGDFRELLKENPNLFRIYTTVLMEHDDVRNGIVEIDKDEIMHFMKYKHKELDKVYRRFLSGVKCYKSFRYENIENRAEDIEKVAFQ